MNTLKATVLTVCIFLVAAEIIARFCPKNEMINFIRGLISVLLLISAVSSLFHLDINWNVAIDQAQEQQNELSGYVEEQMEDSAQRELEKSIRGLLATIDLKPEKIEIFTDITDESSIVLTKVSATFFYESDAQRADADLPTVLGEQSEVEVKADGA